MPQRHLTRLERDKKRAERRKKKYNRPKTVDEQLQTDLLQRFNFRHLFQAIQVKLERPLARKNLEYFESVWKLANATAKHFTVVRHDSRLNYQHELTRDHIPASQQHNWDQVDDKDLIAVLQIQRGDRSFDICLAVASKKTFLTCDDIKFSTPEKTKYNCAFLINLRLTLDMKQPKITEVYISSRGINPLLRGHDLNRHISHFTINDWLAPSYYAHTRLKHCCIHPATWLQLAPNLEEYTRRKRLIAQHTSTSHTRTPWSHLRADENIHEVLRFQYSLASRNRQPSRRIMYAFFNTPTKLLITDGREKATSPVSVTKFFP